MIYGNLKVIDHLFINGMHQCLVVYCRDTITKKERFYIGPYPHEFTEESAVRYVIDNGMKDRHDVFRKFVLLHSQNPTAK